MTNLPPTTAQFSSTPVRAIQKSAADVIGENIRLLKCTTKAGRLAVKLARDCYFGENMMRANTVSGLPKEKLQEIKT